MSLSNQYMQQSGEVSPTDTFATSQHEIVLAIGMKFTTKSSKMSKSGAKFMLTVVMLPGDVYVFLWQKRFKNSTSHQTGDPFC